MADKVEILFDNNGEYLSETTLHRVEKSNEAFRKNISISERSWDIEGLETLKKTHI